MTNNSVVYPAFCWTDRLAQAVSSLGSILRAKKCVILVVLLVVSCLFLVLGHTFGGALLTDGVVRLKTLNYYVWTDDENSWDQQGQQVNVTAPSQKTSPSNITRVLLLTYMRGGSSVLGEAFNQNPEAFHWFEPLDGVYSDLYGTMHGWMPIDILYNDNNTMRTIPQYERDAVVENLDKIFDCNISALPVDVLTNYNFITIIQKRVERYTECIRLGTAQPVVGGFAKYQRSNPSGWTRMLRRMASFHCKRPVSFHCPQSFVKSDDPLLYKCHEELHSGNPSNNVPGKHIPKVILDPYLRCMQQARESCQSCFHILQDDCSSSTLRAAKVIRLNPDIIQDLLRNITDLKLIFYFRDPRAIVWSRKATHLLSKTSKRDAITEGELICGRMRHDLRVMHQLQSKFPGSIFELKYEDLIADPERTVQDIYKFLGLTMSAETTKNFQGILHASQDTGFFGTSRRNATATAGRWIHNIPAKDRIGITTVCSDVLETLGYQP